MRTGRDALVRTLAELVRIDSVNPAFGGPGERRVAEHVRARMEALGMETRWHEPVPGRPSVVGRLPGGGGGRTLMLYAHHDTVGVDGMEAPFEPRVEDGRMYGRGTVDMKGGLAACLAALEAVARRGRPLAGDVLLASVADEEEASLGMEEVLRHHTADGAIVTEPTGLEVVAAHNGFCWMEVRTEGRAAHGSLHAEGIDANLRMGRLLARLDALAAELLRRPPHPLTGPPSLHAATVTGGTGWSTYAAECTVRIERRTIPGERAADAVAEVRAIVDELAAADPTFRATLTPVLARPPWEAPAASPVAEAVLAAATEVLGAPPRRSGAGYWMDTALIGAAGIDAVVIGADGGGAHTPKEWADLESVHRLAEVLVRAIEAFCRERRTATSTARPRSGPTPPAPSRRRAPRR